MRAPPPLAIRLTRFGCWRGALAILASGTAAVTAGWLVASFDQRPITLLIGVSMVGAFVVGALLTAVRVPSMLLRWDGAHWSCAALGDAQADAPAPGALTVALDLGSWLLLRFTADDPHRRGEVRWLPVQRRGLEPQWHALRCAVHAPRPAPAPR